MKLITIIILSILISLNVNAQITLEYTYPNANDIDLIRLANSGDKYLHVNPNSNEFVLYNLDYTEYKTIQIPNISSSCSKTRIAEYSLKDYVSSVRRIGITEYTFDSDNDIEFLASCYDTVTFVQHYAVIDEDQTILWTTDSVEDLYLYSTEQGLKMMVDYIYTMQETYSLPGTILKTLDKEAGSELIAEPNPANVYTKIKFVLPPEDDYGTIDIHSSNGVFIGSYDVNRNQSYLLLDTSSYTSGNYIYTLNSANGSYSQKLSVIQ